MYELIAIAIILAILGGFVALAYRAAKSAGAAEATLTETEADLKAVSELMEDSHHAEKTRAKAIANTRAGIIPDRLQKYYR